MTRSSTKTKGFTLAELLIVIAVIGILASLVLALYSNVKEKTRDVRRLSDMNEIAKALDLYYIINSRYPVATTEITIDGSDVLSTELEGNDLFGNVPSDPRHPTYTYRYVTHSNGTTYTLTFCMETNRYPPHTEGCDNTKTP